jgi:hypothetical protein
VCSVLIVCLVVCFVFIVIIIDCLCRTEAVKPILPLAMMMASKNIPAQYGIPVTVATLWPYLSKAITNQPMAPPPGITPSADVRKSYYCYISKVFVCLCVCVFVHTSSRCAVNNSIYPCDRCNQVDLRRLSTHRLHHLLQSRHLFPMDTSLKVCHSVAIS